MASKVRPSLLLRLVVVLAATVTNFARAAVAPAFDDSYEAQRWATLIRGSIWDGSSWATDGGRAKVDWSRAPFTAAFRGFDVDAACAVGDVTPPCYDDPAALWWNGGEYEALSDAQRAAYEGVRNNSMVYDYCTDELRFNSHVPLECSYN
ncbi:hypothetical protein C2845_PM10G12490 [Panicum miliaceum]|uniref:Xyloglucan endo-transglycosylase C-terminal domain-containing protein n=1 Tax=Panicum miliaceum TaxID=4540 RepID=A0A3L6PA25_PANMI|nr:hypothetical protein C2845_PM10G12490 [Panicum miliaceum]